MLEKVNGCASCLDFTGRHQRDQCWAKQRDGQPFTCSEMVNGVRCNKRHHYMLHGSNNKFSCYVKVNRVHVSAASTVQEEMSGEEAEYLEKLEEEWADLEIPGLSLYVEKLADAERSKVENMVVLHAFVKVDLCIFCQLSKKTKLNFDQEFKAW